MPKIGIIYGMETSFPEALVDHINTRRVPGVVAEHVKIGAVRIADPSGYRVIIDRVSHDIDFYRAYLRNAMLNGAIVINNPFWSSSDDRFFNYALAHKLGIAVPRTAILPHKQHPPGTSVQSMRNLVFPLDWDEVFHYVGFPAYLKAATRAGWSHVHRIESADDFFTAYDESGTLCMMLQQAIEFGEYLRCYVVGQEKTHVMRYDPSQPHHLRYLRGGEVSSSALCERVAKDSLSLCKALGLDFNTLEFAVHEGTPYVIDCVNPASDADMHLVGKDNFNWAVENIANLAIEKALSSERPQLQYRWFHLLDPDPVFAAGK
jgi:hypothetical protein